MLLMCGTLLFGQSQKPQSPPPEEPPEEDTINAPKEYAFNPLQAAKEMKVGAFYLRKGSYRAAARRFEEALKWNPSLSEAYLRLGETYLKAKDRKSARAAYQKYLAMEPDSKEAAEVKKRLASIEN